MDELFRVLVVDDEYLIRKLIIRSIDWEAHQMRVVGEAESAMEAFPLVEELRPDMVLTDICMPVMDGIEFANEILSRYSDMCVAVITGHDDFIYAQRSINAGICGYLLKPIKAEDIRELTQRMKEQLRQQRRAETLPGRASDAETMSPLVARISSYLREHAADPSLKAQRIAAHFHLSKGHLGRLFKKGTGKTPLEYLTEVRIALAKELLRSTDAPAYEIGERVGIPNAHYFGILFKRHTGKTITQYRCMGKKQPYPIPDAALDNGKESLHSKPGDMFEK